MSDQGRQVRLAILFDAENIAASLVPSIFERASAFGSPVIRRAYASYAGENVRCWRSSCYAELGVTPVHVPTVTKGKNAADIALAIDAVEIALTGKADAVCIVSSDGDFAMLGHKLREAGVTVIGFGDHRSPVGWRGACDHFVLSDPSAVAAADLADPTRNRKDALRALEGLIVRMLGDEEGQAGLSDIGTKLKNEVPGFSAKRFGFKKLSDLMRSLEAFEVSVCADGTSLFITLRESVASDVESIQETPESAVAESMEPGAEPMSRAA